MIQTVKLLGANRQAPAHNKVSMPLHQRVALGIRGHRGNHKCQARPTKVVRKGGQDGLWLKDEVKCIYTY